jgi:hypothetical protein
MRRSACLALVVMSLIPSVGRCQSAKGKIAVEIFRAGVKLLTGAVAAESMRRAGNSSVDFRYATEEAILDGKEYERVRRQRIDGVVQQFSSQGLSHDNNTIYSIFLNIDYNVGSVYWADTFSNPDEFFVVEVEGIGQFVLPNIRNEYKGGPVLDRIVLPALSPGTRIVVRVLDDDTNGNEVWNSVLRNRINYRFAIDGAALFATSAFRSQADFSGGFQLLDTPQRLVLDGPDQIATVVFRVPEVQDNTWVADGELRDSNNRPAGRVQFSQVWNARSELASLERELEVRAANAKKKAASSFGWLIFWVVIGIVGLTWFYKSFADKQAQTANKPVVVPNDAA